jgi:hypothetical protein
MLTVLQEKLAEAHGLAMAATVVTAKVEEIVSDAELQHELRHMRGDAEETRARCLAEEARFGEEAAREMRSHAQTTKEKGADLVGAWFKAGTGPLAAWSFLAMGEAAEVATWRALVMLARKSPGGAAVEELARWAVDIQERHLRIALDGATRLAQLVDADAPRWG